MHQLLREPKNSQRPSGLYHRKSCIIVDRRTNDEDSRDHKRLHATTDSVTTVPEFFQRHYFSVGMHTHYLRLVDNNTTEIISYFQV